jgi:preprotein translocase subunit SecE
MAEKRENKKIVKAAKSAGGRLRWLVPKFLREAWREVRQVTWPGKKETARLTLAVFIFSIIFGAFVAAVDYGLDKLFKEVILK